MNTDCIQQIKELSQCMVPYSYKNKLTLFDAPVMALYMTRSDCVRQYKKLLAHFVRVNDETKQAICFNRPQSDYDNTLIKVYNHYQPHIMREINKILYKNMPLYEYIKFRYLNKYHS